MQWGCSTHYISGFQRSSWDIKAHPKWLHSQEVTGSKRNLWWRSSEYWPPFFFFGKACSWLGGDKNESSGELEKSWILIRTWSGKLNSCIHTYAHACVCAQSYLTLWDPMDCSPPSSSVHEDSPGKNTSVGCHISFARGSSQPSDRTPISCIGKWIL